MGRGGASRLGHGGRQRVHLGRAVTMHPDFGFWGRCGPRAPAALLLDWSGVPAGDRVVFRVRDEIALVEPSGQGCDGKVVEAAGRGRSRNRDGACAGMSDGERLERVRNGRGRRRGRRSEGRRSDRRRC